MDKEIASKLDAAAAATKSLQDQAFKASEVLRRGFDGQIMVNFCGIYTDPQKRLSDFRIAREQIDKAIALIEATNWPTEADYRKEENV